MLTEKDIRAEINRIRGSATRMQIIAPDAACVVCGTTAKVQAHHESYFAPREVTPLCGVHHKARHRELRALGVNPVLLYIDGRLGGAPRPFEAGRSQAELNGDYWKLVHGQGPYVQTWKRIHGVSPTPGR
jgi:hypothetical protein